MTTSDSPRDCELRRFHNWPSSASIFQNRSSRPATPATRAGTSRSRNVRTNSRRQVALSPPSPRKLRKSASSHKPRHVRADFVQCKPHLDMPIRRPVTRTLTQQLGDALPSTRTARTHRRERGARNSSGHADLVDHDDPRSGRVEVGSSSLARSAELEIERRTCLRLATCRASVLYLSAAGQKCTTGTGEVGSPRADAVAVLRARRQGYHEYSARPRLFVPACEVVE